MALMVYKVEVELKVSKIREEKRMIRWVRLDIIIIA